MLLEREGPLPYTSPGPVRRMLAREMAPPGVEMAILLADQSHAVEPVVVGVIDCMPAALDN